MGWNNTLSKFVMGTTTADGTATSVDNNTGYSTGTLVANLSGDVTGTVLTATQNSITTMTGLTAVGTSGTNTAFSGPIAANETIITASGNLVVDPATQILEIKGDGSSIVGQIQLNCQNNNHGQKIKSQPHSESVSNEMTLPKGADSTLVSEIAVQTLTNKTLTSPTITGTGTIAGTFTGAVDGIVGGTTPAAVTGTVITANTNFAGPLTGAVDGIVGGTTPAAVTGTVITANTNFAGPLTGAVTGNVTGDLNGYIRDPNGNVVLDNGTLGATPNFGGNVSGDVTGNVLTTDSNGINPSTVLNANAGSNSAAIFTGDVTGDVTGTIQTATQNIISTMTGLTAVGTTAVNTTFTGPVVANEGVVSNGNITMTGKFLKQFLPP
jgi:hypothetical protein